MTRAQEGADCKQAGYTLLEVIVALTLLSMLAVMLSGSLSFGSRVWESTSRSARVNGDLVSAYQFLNLSFGRLAKPSGTSDQPERTPEQDSAVDFLGTSHDLTFRTDGFAAVGLSGPRLVRLQVVADRLEVSILDPDGPAVAPGDRDFVLIPSTKSIALAYRGRNDTGSDTGWIDGWSQGRSFPAFVRVTIERFDDQMPSWVFRLPDALSEAPLVQ